ncbi:MAG TPA: DNA replication and repair protein RecF [Pyrinomonadaceae bacterium]|nr:DNA replication and repair protein RecF [Pyrinomonadaceae bacterium]
MFLRSIEAIQFRNLSGEITWGNGLNILHGNNAQGKTNWLEAVYMLAHAKSFRTHHLKESVKFGEREAAVKGVVTTGKDFERELQVSLNGTTKQTLINGKRESIARYAAHLYAVCFTADELEVIRGGPEARRSFLDRGAISLHPPYAQTIADYNKVIKQKKRLLQQAAEDRVSLDALANLVQPWNQQLISLATQIHRARNRYVELLNEALDHNLFHDDISIRYVSSLEGKGDLADYRSLVTARLQIRMEAELFAGACLIGPHRDDLLVLFGGRDIRSFGSSGQQRSALITLDLAAISVYYSKHQNYPIFLIDDVDAELDGNRINRLLEYLDGRTQTFITTSKRSHFERFESRASFYEVCAGVATAEQTLNAVSVSA